ncbi:raffinose/stachyose/melibiose transport system substrate-binding protein [Agromyces sp. CF514]|uniref:ABC transporter substrate-binding protein n=1 Tax=Agromyces sp. CF514 TaxID=1881031 RepID=UPI0008EE5930|nr:extracellular solute-binding protein [Agromyces sp. CF514]SFR83188.1 raffinose/stachyose/melibiose transport system substrate-binding protein [Agromyces sp. CF514]
MGITKRGIGAVAALAATAALLTGCSTGGGSDPNTLKLWHFEGTDSDVGIAWNKAIEIFEEETGATVEYEDKSFEQIRSTASQVLNSNEAPDVMESPKGNATAGLLASQGLLADITDAVEEYGWDDLLAPSLQTTAKYSDEGIMGSGPWYGVPNYGEYVTVYYNKTAFDEKGLAEPTTYAEFEEILDAFAKDGTTPLAQAGAEYPLGQLFYQLALSKADRQFVNDYQLYENPVDWQGPELTYAADKIVEYVDNGWISKDSTGLKAEDMGVGFMSGEYPMMVSGSWWAGRVINEATTFEWDTFAFPESQLVPGSSGNIWVVPENAANKDLAYKFIDITMRPEIQALIGNNGSIPVAADPADITDEKSAALITEFNEVVAADGLAFYPDWPTPNFYDQLVGALQELVNGTLTPEQTLEQLGTDYEDGVADIIG